MEKDVKRKCSLFVKINNWCIGMGSKPYICTVNIFKGVKGSANSSIKFSGIQARIVPLPHLL